MARSVATDAKVTNQMRLSNPLLLVSLGVLFAAASCTLITDVDRSKIPDGQTAGVPGAGGDNMSAGGSTMQPPGGEGGSGASAPIGGGGAGGAGGGGGAGGSGGAPEGGAGAGAAGGSDAGSGGLPADIGGAGAGGTAGP